MVFMTAETVEDFGSLDVEARDDIAELMQLPASDSLDIFVQLHEDAGARRIHVGHGSQNLTGQDLVHEGGQALTRFVSDAWKRAPRREPGDRSMLVLWGHSYRFAVGQTATSSGGVDALDFAELSKILAGMPKAPIASGRAANVFDIIGFDACDLATVEVAVQLQPHADYLLASEMGIPLPGWPYFRALERLADPIATSPDRVMGAAELGSYAVRRYCEHYKADDRAVSLTLLGLSGAQQLAARVEVLARKLASAVTRSPREKSLILGLFSRAQTQIDKPMVDVADLCLNLMRECGDLELRVAAERVGDLLITPLPVLPGTSEAGGGRPFIQEHGRNAAKTAKLNGVSLYAPHVAGPHDFEAARSAYDRFTFAQASVWNRLVHNLARSL